MVRYLANRTKVLLFGVQLLLSGESEARLSGQSEARLSGQSVCLCQLINTKTHDGKQTLMHFLADSIEKRFPDVMDFASEMLHVEKAARGQHFCCDNNHTTLMFAWSFLNALSLSARRQKGRAFVPSKNVLLF